VLLLVDYGVGHAGDYKVLQEVFWFLGSDHQATAQTSEVRSELLYRLHSKASSMDASFSGSESGVHGRLLVAVEARIKTEHRDDFLVLEIGLARSPVKDRVVMESQVVSEPKDNSVHLGRIKFQSL
jgi:hypothetical protein